MSMGRAALSNLDAQLRVEMRREIRALQQRLGITMLFVTHDQLEAMTMADQVILMRGGHIEQQGTPAELYERPASVFAARFIGTPPMNVLSGRVLEAIGPGNLPGFPPASTPARCPLACVRKMHDCRRRASKELSQASNTGGADSLVEVRVGAEPFTVRVGGRATVGIGEAVHVAWEPSATHWFDGTTGLRRE